MSRTETLAVRLTKEDRKRVEAYAKGMRWTVSGALQFMVGSFFTSLRYK